MNNISNALHLLLAIFSIWYLLICWSEYRLDVLRQRLFAVRDDLLLSAAKGEIEFSDSSYVRLRKLMNGLIRYAHRYSIPQMVTTWLAIKSVVPESFINLWNQDLALLPDGKRALMQNAHNKMQLVLTKHLKTSFVGLLLAPVLYFFRVLHSMNMNKRPVDTLSPKQKMLNHLEDETYTLEKSAKDTQFKYAHSHS
jgi:hypothetical protein